MSFFFLSTYLALVFYSLILQFIQFGNPVFVLIYYDMICIVYCKCQRGNVLRWLTSIYFPLQIDFPCNSHISSMGPLSTSDENTAAASTETSSSSSTVGTTAESFMEKRIRHTSMPQQRVAAASAAVPSSSSNSSSSNSSSGIAASNHLHHHLEPSLSHAEVRNFHGFHREQHRTHATITSNSAASMDSGLMESGWNSGSTNPYQAVNIPGKLLSLRLKKGQIDKAHKDKSSKTFPENFSVTLFLLKPEDQSDNLLDYSLYTPMLNQNVAETPHTTITAVANMSNNKVNPASSTTNNSSEKQFTVVPVSDADHQLKHPGHPKPRVRPLTGGSGASSSSATPSLKSVEQSSQDSEGANSESDEDMKHASGDFRMNSDSSSTENHHQQHNENNPKCNNLRLKQRATIRPQSNWVWNSQHLSSVNIHHNICNWHLIFAFRNFFVVVALFKKKMNCPKVLLKLHQTIV